jgi:hypothetical protein
MNRAQSIVIGTSIIATLVNIYGAIRNGRDATVPIIGGFVVSTILLGVAEIPEAQVLAEAFGAAFLITSATLNAGDLIATVTSFTGGTPVAPSTRTPSTPTAGGGGGKPAAVQ